MQVKNWIGFENGEERDEYLTSAVQRAAAQAESGGRNRAKGMTGKLHPGVGIRNGLCPD